MNDTSLVTRIYVEGGHYIRASEGIDDVAMLQTNARAGDGWIIVQDPGTGVEKYVLASRVLWLEQEYEDAS